MNVSPSKRRDVSRAFYRSLMSGVLALAAMFLSDVLGLYVVANYIAWFLFVFLFLVAILYAVIALGLATEKRT